MRIQRSVFRAAARAVATCGCALACGAEPEPPAAEAPAPEAPRAETAAPETPGPAADVVAVLALEGDVEQGKRAYTSCGVCHGADGRGRADGTFPQLAGQHRSVLIKQLVDIREGRRHNPVMAPYAEALIDAQEIADVTRYIGSLEPPRPEAGEADPAGEALYVRDCQACHGEGGGGNAAGFVPRLAGQHEAYLLRQIQAIAGGRRENAHPARRRLVADYRDAELRAVVAYAARVRSPDAAGSVE